MTQHGPLKGIPVDIKVCWYASCSQRNHNIVGRALAISTSSPEHKRCPSPPGGRMNAKHPHRCLPLHPPPIRNIYQEVFSQQRLARHTPRTPTSKKKPPQFYNRPEPAHAAVSRSRGGRKNDARRKVPSSRHSTSLAAAPNPQSWERMISKTGDRRLGCHYKSQTHWSCNPGWYEDAYEF